MKTVLSFSIYRNIVMVNVGNQEKNDFTDVEVERKDNNKNKA